MNWRVLPPLASLRAFVAYAETGNLTEAADALGVSHPAVSQHLRTLETHLGVPLLMRGRRSMSLTAEGEVLARAATHGFTSIIQAVEALTGAEDARPLHVSTTASFASAWLMPRLASFRAAHPNIDIVINPIPELVTLEPGGVDVAIRYGAGPWDGLETTMLVRSPIVVVAAPQLFGTRDPSSIEDVAGLPWLEELGKSEGSDWLDARGATNVRRGPAVQVPGNLMLDGARDGQGVAVTTRCFVEADLAAGRLILVDESTATDTGYQLVTRPGPHRDALKAFLRWIKKAAET